MEMKRNPSRNNNFKSFDSIIMKFPQFREGLKEIRNIFEQYGEFSTPIEIVLVFLMMSLLLPLPQMKT